MTWSEVVLSSIFLQEFGFKINECCFSNYVHRTQTLQLFSTTKLLCWKVIFCFKTNPKLVTDSSELTTAGQLRNDGNRIKHHSQSQFRVIDKYFWKSKKEKNVIFYIPHVSQNNYQIINSYRFVKHIIDSLN